MSGKSCKDFPHVGSLHYAYCSRLVVVGVFGGVALVLPIGGLELDLLHGAFGLLYHYLGRCPTVIATSA